MYCPRCGQEYNNSAAVCTDCGVGLTTIPPPEEPPAEWVELVTVLETRDPSRFLSARSALQAAGIPCFCSGELLQFNLAVGPVRLQVPKDRGDDARSVLETDAAVVVDPTAPEPGDSGQSE